MLSTYLTAAPNWSAAIYAHNRWETKWEQRNIRLPEVGSPRVACVPAKWYHVHLGQRFYTTSSAVRWQADRTYRIEGFQYLESCPQRRPPPAKIDVTTPGTGPFWSFGRLGAYIAERWGFTLTHVDL